MPFKLSVRLALAKKEPVRSDCHACLVSLRQPAVKSPSANVHAPLLIAGSILCRMTKRLSRGLDGGHRLSNDGQARGQGQSSGQGGHWG